jgi:hypothetical protein
VTQTQASYDSPWKEALEQYFEPFLAFFFPKAHNEIDWQRGYEFLDKELQQIVVEAELGKRIVDKLVKVWQLDGEETWVLLHIEIQSQVDSDFTKRMYTYNYRIFDRYNRKVVSLAVLGDMQDSWRPQEYSYELWGCRASLQFPIVKLLDYEKQWKALEESTNPFAVVVMAHLRTQTTSQNPEARLQWKISLIKQLYQKGYSRENILQLFRLINWMMTLPEKLEQICDTEINSYENQNYMPYITTVERRAMLKIQRESVIDVLTTRFEEVPSDLIETINNLSEVSQLKQLLKQAITISSIEEFQQLLIE